MQRVIWLGIAARQCRLLHACPWLFSKIYLWELANGKVIFSSGAWAGAGGRVVWAWREDTCARNSASDPRKSAVFALLRCRPPKKEDGPRGPAILRIRERQGKGAR